MESLASISSPLSSLQMRYGGFCGAGSKSAFKRGLKHDRRGGKKIFRKLSFFFSPSLPFLIVRDRRNDRRSAVAARLRAATSTLSLQVLSH